MTSPILEVLGATKTYASFEWNIARFASWFGYNAQPVREFSAIQNVSLTLHPGEALALIGPNGAGKSTLLKIVAGIVRPTAGRITLRGRASSILELGFGFNHELTGRQNASHLCSLTGGAVDIGGLIAEIERFAELDDFFDQPLRLYSSGMHARLAFSIATATRPDLLVIDEILSVGDSYFQHKSFDRIRQYKEAGTAILFVSHSTADVRALCDRAMLIDNGRCVKEGAADAVIDFYNAMVAQKRARPRRIAQERRSDGWLVTRSGTFEATARSLDLLDEATGEPVTVAQVGQRLTIRLLVAVHRDIEALVVGYMIRDRTGHIVWGTNTWHTDQLLRSLRAGEEVEVLMPFTCSLGPGSYALTHALTMNEHHLLGNYEWIDNRLVFDVVNADRAYFVGSVCLDAEFRIMRA